MTAKDKSSREKKKSRSRHASKERSESRHSKSDKRSRHSRHHHRHRSSDSQSEKPAQEQKLPQVESKEALRDAQPHTPPAAAASAADHAETLLPSPHPSSRRSSNAGSKRRRRSTAQEPPVASVPSLPAVSELPALHVTARSCPASATQTARRGSSRKASATSAAEAPSVTIPRGLMPKSVPKPLRAVEMRGKLPKRDYVSADADNLFSRWVNAYNFGTAAEGEYSFYHFGDKDELASRRSHSHSMLVPLLEEDDVANSKRAPRAAAAVPVPAEHSTLPESKHRGDSDSDSEEAWINQAGYFVVDATQGRQNGDGDADDSSSSSSSSSVEVSEKGANEADPAVSTGSSVPPSVVPAASSHAPVSALTSTATRQAPAQTSPQDPSLAARLWTPSPGPGEPRRPWTPMQELYPMPSANSDDEAAANANTTLAKPSTQDKMPFIEDGIEQDADVSDDESRHLVSVTQLSGVSDNASSSAGTLHLPGSDADDREMGNEVTEDDDRSESDGDGDGVDRRYGWVSSHAMEEDGIVHSNENAAGRVYAPPRVERQSSLLAMHRSPSPSGGRVAVPMSLSGNTATEKPAASRKRSLRVPQTRFRRGGHSASVLGARRLLTLLVLNTPAPKVVATDDGAVVSLPDGDDGGTERVTVDEAVVVRDESKLISTPLLREVAEELAGGHCAHLLLSVGSDCGTVGCRVVETTLTMLLAAMVKREKEVQSSRLARGLLADADDAYFKLETSIALIHKGKYTKDLIQNREEELGALAPTRPIGSPLLTCWCDNTMFQSVRSASQLRSLLEPVERWLSKTPEEAEKAREVVCVYVALRQAENLLSPEEARKLTMSSLLIYISRSEDGVMNILHDFSSATPLQRSLLRRVGNGGFTVVASCVGAKSRHACQYATACAEAAALPNNGYNNGNAQRYIANLREMVESEKWQASGGGDDDDNDDDDDEKTRQARQQRRNVNADVLRRMTCLLRDPTNCTTPFFPDRVSAREEEQAKAAQRDTGSLGSSMTSGMMPQSILATTHNIPIATLSEALQMFSDCRVHTVTIRSTRVLCGYGLIEGTTNGLYRVSDRATVYLDEVRDRHIMPKLHTLSISKNTSALCSLFINGYNTGLLSFDGRSKNLFASPSWYVLAESIDRALSRPDVRHRDVRMAFSAINCKGEVLDLMTPGATMVPLQVSSSPLFGAAVHSSRLYPQTSADALRNQLSQCSAVASPIWGPNVFLHVLLVNVFRTEDDDVMVCSMNMSVFGSHATLCQRVLSGDKGLKLKENTTMHPGVAQLLHGPLSGSAATVFLTCLDNIDDAQAALEMTEKETAALTKTANRCGSVRDFVERTRSGLEKRRRKAEAISPEERAHFARLERRIAVTLDDYAKLLEPNCTDFPKSYLTEQMVGSHHATGGVARSRDVTPTPQQLTAIPQRPPPPPPQLQLQQQQQLQQQAVPKLFTPTPPPPRRRSTTPIAASLAAAPPPLPKTVREDSAEVTSNASRNGPSSNAEVDADVTSANSSAATVVSHPQWVLGLELSGSTVKAVQASREELEWLPTRERFETDSILFYNSTQADMNALFTVNCEAVQVLLADARAARSCAILGVGDHHSGTRATHVRTLPLWRSFAALVLNSAFQGEADGSTWRDGSELHIRMSAVQDRTLLHDFLLTDDDDTTSATTAAPTLPARVALAANPLFGPVVRNTTVMRAANTAECRYILRSGLDALDTVAGTYPSGTVIIASAVLKNVTTNDVLFSSITAFGVRVGKDLPALRDILAMDPKGGASPSLYQYALKGPCRLLCLTTLDSATSSQSVEALRLSQMVRYGTTPPVPTGSLRTCLQEQQEQLRRSLPQDPTRSNTEHVIRQLSKMLSDPLAPIVIFPFDDDGIASPQDRENMMKLQSKNAALTPAGSPGTVGVGGGRLCRCTAVITAAGRNDDDTTLDARTETNTVHIGDTTYPFSEVVLRADNSSVLRPGLISSIVEHVQQGRNTTLVVADGSGSNAGASLLSKLVSLFIRNTGDDGHGVNTTLFMSIAAVRFPAEKDVSELDTVSSDSDRDQDTVSGGATVKDLFSSDADFYPLRVARSPFFGPCVDGARFSSLSRIGDVYLTLKDAQKACSFLKATLVVAIVLKQVLRGQNGVVQDTLMSSLFSVISTAETSSDAYACNIFHRMLDQRDAALAAQSLHDPRATAWRGCLLAHAFGGDSFTYGVVGLKSNTAATEAMAMMSFGSRLLHVSCRVPAKASAVEMLARARQRLQGAAEATPPQVDYATALSSMEWDWGEIKAEAEAMLTSPDTCKPRAFLCE